MMNRKTCLSAVALTVCFAMAYADVAIPVASDSFDSYEDNTTISQMAAASVECRTNLQWSALQGAESPDLSKVVGQKLVVDTEGDSILATMADNTDLNSALGGTMPEGATGEIYLDAFVKFVPSDELEVFTDEELAAIKFAVYAYEGESATNLVVGHKYEGAYTNDVIGNIVFPGENDRESHIVVTLKRDDLGVLRFMVSIDGVIANSSLIEGDSDWFEAISDGAIQGISLKGTGSVDQLSIGYRARLGFSPGTSDGVKPQGAADPIDLTEGQAGYLNAVLDAGGTVDGVIANIATMTQEQFDKAYILSQDLTQDTLPEPEFSITKVVRDSANIIITVKLVRGAALGGINGTLSVKTSSDAAVYNETSANFTNEDFAGGDEATITIPAQDAVIFKANIR